MIGMVCSKPRTGNREVAGEALSWQELLVVIISAETQRVWAHLT